MISAIIYVMRYAEKVKKDPTKSIVYDMKEENEKNFLTHKEGQEFPELNGKRKLILFIFALTFIVMVIGVIPFSDINITFIPPLGWWFGELTALFLISAIIIVLIDGQGEEGLISSFTNGARIFWGKPIVEYQSITIVMNAGNITDTVLNLGERTLAGTGSIACNNSISFLFANVLPNTFNLRACHAFNAYNGSTGGFAGLQDM